MKKILKKNLQNLFAAISKETDLFLPVLNSAKNAEFKKWTEGTEYSEELNTVRSAKDFFFPQTENICDFKTSGKNIEIIENSELPENFAVFGVRACDLKSFEVLDNVFLSEPVDSFYKTRRENAVIFTMACNRPKETCFCHTFNINAADPKGDVECFEDETYVYLNPLTQKGKDLLNKVTSALEDETEEPVKKIKAEIEERLSDKNIHINLTKEAKDYLVDIGYDKDFGARPLKRVVSRTIENMIAEKIILGEIKYGVTITFDYNKELYIK